MSLKGCAKDTLSIIEKGFYETPSGKTCSIKAELDNALSGTRLYRPEHDFVYETVPCGNDLKLEVCAESTIQTALRLVARDGIQKVAALNFASAKNPGGGFLGGAKAQEEDLARCSALYPCLLTQKEYYEKNRACASLLYTDHLIYSPDVPVFRDETLCFLESPFLLSFITTPAPNAGEMLIKDASAGPQIEEALRRRARIILQVAQDNGHKTLILGAWGCGVFRNSPEMVAKIFAEHLSSSKFKNTFERVIFAIYDRSPQQGTLNAFRKVFEEVAQLPGELK